MLRWIARGARGAGPAILRSVAAVTDDAAVLPTLICAGDLRAADLPADTGHVRTAGSAGGAVVSAAQRTAAAIADDAAVGGARALASRARRAPYGDTGVARGVADCPGRATATIEGVPATVADGGAVLPTREGAAHWRAARLAAEIRHPGPAARLGRRAARAAVDRAPATIADRPAIGSTGRRATRHAGRTPRNTAEARHRGAAHLGRGTGPAVEGSAAAVADGATVLATNRRARHRRAVGIGCNPARIRARMDRRIDRGSAVGLRYGRPRHLKGATRSHRNEHGESQTEPPRSRISTHPTVARQTDRASLGMWNGHVTTPRARDSEPSRSWRRARLLPAP